MYICHQCLRVLVVQIATFMYSISNHYSVLEVAEVKTLFLLVGIIAISLECSDETSNWILTYMVTSLWQRKEVLMLSSQLGTRKWHSAKNSWNSLRPLRWPQPCGMFRNRGLRSTAMTSVCVINECVVTNVRS